MTAAPQQIDFIRFEDNRAAMRLFLCDSVERIGLAQVAHLVRRDPSTISHQLSGLDKNKQPSAELVFACWLLDSIFRERAAGLLGEFLSRPPDLTPEQAMREAQAKALARGYIDVQDLAAIFARAKMSGEGSR